MGDVGDLRAFVEARLQAEGTRGKPLSARAAAARTEGTADAISRETIAKILRGEHSGEITDRIARGLAAALGTTAKAVYAAARVRPSLGEFSLPDRASRLTPSERRVVVSVVDAILVAADQVDRPAAQDARPALRVARKKEGDGRR